MLHVPRLARPVGNFGALYQLIADIGDDRLPTTVRAYDFVLGAVGVDCSYLHSAPSFRRREDVTASVVFNGKTISVYFTTERGKAFLNATYPYHPHRFCVHAPNYEFSIIRDPYTDLALRVRKED
jgi:hypothetical protein